MSGTQSRKQKILGDVKRKRRQRTIASFTIAIVLIVVVVVAVYFATISSGGILIPANVGLDATCTRPLHTHDVSGTIHVEPAVDHNFTVGDFFLIWNKVLNKTGVFPYNQALPSYLDCVTGTSLAYHAHPTLSIFYKKNGPPTINMTVNGNPEPLLQNYVFLKNAATAAAPCTPPAGVTGCVPDNVIITYGPGVPAAF